MSVLIKGMEMPKACYECRMYEADIYYCVATERDIDIPSLDEGRCSFCPLIELTDHGDLIDREVLKKSLIDEGETMGIDGFSIDGLSVDDVCCAIENALVVIPAERS